MLTDPQQQIWQAEEEEVEIGIIFEAEQENRARKRETRKIKKKIIIER